MRQLVLTQLFGEPRIGAAVQQTAAIVLIYKTEGGEIADDDSD